MNYRIKKLDEFNIGEEKIGSENNFKNLVEMANWKKEYTFLESEEQLLNNPKTQFEMNGKIVQKQAENLSIKIDKRKSEYFLEKQRHCLILSNCDIVN